MRIPYYPSRESRVKKLLEVFEPEPNSKIIDLGSGDGRVLREFANKYDDIKLYGIEKDWKLVYISRNLSKEFKNIDIKQGNLFDVPLDNYDVVYTYLTVDALRRLRNKAVKFVDRGGTWIALDYRIPGLKPVVVIDLDKWHKYYIYSKSYRKIGKIFKVL